MPYFVRLLAFVLLLSSASVAAHAVCVPSNALPGMIGCWPVVTTMSNTTDYFDIWQPGPFPASANLISPANVFRSPPPIGSTTPNAGAFTTVTASEGYQQNGVTVLTIKGGNVTFMPPFPSCSGNCTTLVGAGAGSALDPLDYLTTAVGFHALHSANSAVGLGTESTATGWNAGGNLTGSAALFDTIYGVDALGSCSTGCITDIAIGTDAMRNTLSMVSSIAIGNSSGSEGAYSGLIAIGHSAHKMNVNGLSSGLGGTADIAIGNQSMFCQNATTATDNIAIGDHSLFSCTSAIRNIVIGLSAGGAMTNDTSDVYIGWKAAALANGTANNNCIGQLCLGLGVFTGSQVNAIGTLAGADATSAFASNFLGYSAGQHVTTGIFNLFLGDSVGQTVTTGSRNILIATGNSAVEPPSASTIGYFNMENVLTIAGMTTPATSRAEFIGSLGVGAASTNATFTVGDPVGGSGPHIAVIPRAVPTLTSCGAGASIDANASDTAGTVTQGATATGCTVNFEASFPSFPHCVVSSWAGNSTLVSLSGVGGSFLSVTNSSATGDVFSYVCLQ